MRDRKPFCPVAAPPLRSARIAAAHGVAATLDPEFLRLRRLACVLAAFTLPALGIVCADMVPRSRLPGASQAAAPTIPLPGAAAAHRTAKAPVREAALQAAAPRARP